MTGSAKQSIVPQARKLDCFIASLPAMTVKHELAISRREAPESLKEIFRPEKEGARECRMPSASAASCALGW
jgi:hypothetical protein